MCLIAVATIPAGDQSEHCQNSESICHRKVVRTKKTVPKSESSSGDGNRTQCGDVASTIPSVDRWHPLQYRAHTFDFAISFAYSTCNRVEAHLS